MGIHLVTDDVFMLCEQGVVPLRGCMCGGCVVEVVGVDCLDEEVSVGGVFCVRTCLPLPLSMVTLPLLYRALP